MEVLNLSNAPEIVSDKSQLMPYEKFMLYGPESLSDEELLAIIIRTGTVDKTPTQIGREILSLQNCPQKGLSALFHASVKDLCKISGIGEVKAVKLKCVTELSKRLSMLNVREKLSFESSESVAEYYMESLRHQCQENVLLVCLDNKLSLLNELIISKGSVNTSILSPRDVFKTALSYGAVNIVLLHNHPAGDPSPSKEDLAVTDRIRSLGMMLDIHLLDHIIIGDGTYYSFRERKLI